MVAASFVVWAEIEPPVKLRHAKSHRRKVQKNSQHDENWQADFPIEQKLDNLIHGSIQKVWQIPEIIKPFNIYW